MAAGRKQWSVSNGRSLSEYSSKNGTENIHPFSLSSPSEDPRMTLAPSNALSSPETRSIEYPEEFPASSGLAKLEGSNSANSQTPFEPSPRQLDGVSYLFRRLTAP